LPARLSACARSSVAFSGIVSSSQSSASRPMRARALNDRTGP
jgi:hypothetical protein